MKVVINKCFGGFSVSPAAEKRLRELGCEEFRDGAIQRDDARLIQVVQEMGRAASGPHAALVIVEIPDGTDYEISELDGMEHVAEKHRTWG